VHTVTQFTSKVINMFRFSIPVSAFALIKLFCTRAQIRFFFTVQFYLTTICDVVSWGNFSCSFVLLSELGVVLSLPLRGVAGV